MTRTELYRQLTSLTEKELYYKKAHEEGVVIENDTQLPHVETEHTYFPSTSEDNSQNLYLLKHPCYCPSLPHSHDYFEIIYLLKGTFRQTIVEKQLHMQPGDLCLIPPNTTHCMDSRNNSTIINILIRRDSCEQIFTTLSKDSNVLSSFFTNNIYVPNVNDYIIFHTEQDGFIRNTILDMYLESENKEQYFEMILDSLLILLFGHLLRHHTDSCEFPRFTKRANSQIFGMIQYINENYQTISLKDLADKFHYSPEYTSKFIHTNTGQTFSALLTQIRMEQAKGLLRSTHMSIADIATTVGYQAPENFIRTFKKMFDETPASYKKSSRITG